VLALTHLVAGAALGRLNRDRRGGALAGVVSHALLDGIGHDDLSVGVIGQAALVTAGVAALALSCGAGSVVTVAGLAAVAPDAEIILMKLRGQETRRLIFPSHWQRQGRRGEHPYRLPGPGVSIGVEIALSVAACAALCVAGRRRTRRRGREGLRAFEGTARA
jgi:hypothetical protein